MRFLIVLAALFFAASAYAQELAATFVGMDGEPKGTASVSPSYGGSLLHVELAGLPEGWHGVHFHEKASCDVAAKFESAGEHVILNDGNVHGVMAQNGPHAGDLPNVWVDSQGEGKAEFFTPYIKPADLLDANGSAMVIHAGADDYKTQPSGGSGDRIACAPLTKK